MLWEYCIDGIHYQPWFTNLYCITAPLPLDASLWLRVTVTCGTQVVTDWFYTENTDEDPCNQTAEMGFIMSDTKSYYNIENENRFICYPNPLSNSLTLQFAVNNDDTKVEVQLIDIKGKVILQMISEKYQMGSFNKSVDISKLQSGYYIIKTKIGNELITKSIVKL
jgi:hypothetical protein